MAKEFYTTGVGAEQVLHESPTEKIPIYDSQQDAESDLANLEEGQIVGTKEDKFDVDDMKDYIRKQNVLSDYENFAITTTNQELQYDGVWVGESSAGSGTNIYINDVVVTGGQYGSSGYGDGLCVPFRKGDNIRYSPDSPSVSKIAYYKLRDYSDR